MNWKHVQYKNGKFKTDEGSGGSSTLADLTDTSITNPQDDEVLTYDSQTQKWENKSNNKALHVYSTTEQRVGTWVNGKPVYERVIHHENTRSTFSDYVTIETIQNIIPIRIEGIAKRNTGTYYSFPSRPESGDSPQYNIALRVSDGSIQYRIDQYGRQITDMYIFIQYIKTTD